MMIPKQLKERKKHHRYDDERIETKEKKEKKCNNF